MFCAIRGQLNPTINLWYESFLAPEPYDKIQVPKKEKNVSQ